MQNYVSINFIYLRDKIRASQVEFAAMFSTTKEIIGAYENDRKKFVDLELFQAVCKYFEITLDDFVNVDLSKKKDSKHYVNEPSEIYKIENPIELYERMLLMKDEIIEKKQFAYDAVSKEKNQRIETLENQIEVLIKTSEEKSILLDKYSFMINAINNQNNKN